MLCDSCISPEGLAPDTRCTRNSIPTCNVDTFRRKRSGSISLPTALRCASPACVRLRSESSGSPAPRHAQAQGPTRRFQGHTLGFSFQLAHASGSVRGPPPPILNPVRTRRTPRSRFSVCLIPTSAPDPIAPRGSRICKKSQFEEKERSRRI